MAEQPPRPRPPAPPDPDTIARLVEVEQKLARLGTGTPGPTADEHRQALQRISDLSRQVEELQAKAEQQPQPAETNSAALEARFAAVEQQSARAATTAPSQSDYQGLALRLTAVETKQQQPEADTPQAPPSQVQPADDKGPRLAALEQTIAQMLATGPSRDDLRAVLERVSGVESVQQKAAEAQRTAAVEAQRNYAIDITALKGQVTAAMQAAQQAAAVAQDVQAVARDVADIKAQQAGAPIADAIGRQADARQQGGVDFLSGLFNSDKVLATALTRNGLSISDAAIVAMAASKLTGDVATAQMSTNVVAAINASSGGADASKVSTGDLPSAQMQTNAATAVNAGATAVNGSKVTGALDSTVTIGGNKLTGNLALAGGQNIGVFGATAVSQRTRGGTTVNNVALSTGTTDTIADLTGVYAADASIIAGNLYQIARILGQYDAAFRPAAGYGLLT